jgi:hypothetical protein
MDDIKEAKQEAKEARAEWGLQIDALIEQIYDNPEPEAQEAAAEAARREIRKIHAAANQAAELLASAQDWLQDLANGVQPDLDD